MAKLATEVFLAQLKSLYPASAKPSSRLCADSKNPWYLVATAAFNASNRPDGVPKVFEFVMRDLAAESSEESSLENKLRVTRLMREALFKSGMTSGYSRAISSLVALYEVTPEELRETKLIRDVDNDTVADLVARGDQLFATMYGETASSVQSLLEVIHPDLGWFSKNIAYGHIYNANHVLSQRDTSYAMVATLISMDTPRQAGWHLATCRRGGASLQEVQAVRRIAMEVAGKCGVVWRDGVPEVEGVEKK
ncbi:hypothetical protein DFH11DRAFT_250548 [Phellopilus nigrolimitatus]|nr:hypothetical protein DFH11DRAFT_250548 [Phellopilus nigrolimitatus]